MREKNISQQVLADNLKTNQSAIGRLLDTKSSEISVISQEMLFNIAGMLNVSYLELIGQLPADFYISSTEIEHPERFANAVFKFMGHGLQKIEILTLPQEEEDQKVLRALAIKIEELKKLDHWNILTMSSIDELDLKLELNNFAKHFLDDRRFEDGWIHSGFKIFGILYKELVFDPKGPDGPRTFSSDKFLISLAKNDEPIPVKQFPAYVPEFDYLEVPLSDVLEHRYWHQKLLYGGQS
jgi:transcriptional regulator with XRE-family HTH domain